MFICGILYGGVKDLFVWYFFEKVYVNEDSLRMVSGYVDLIFMLFGGDVLYLVGWFLNVLVLRGLILRFFVYICIRVVLF